MNAELTAFIGASPHERTETRSNNAGKNDPVRSLGIRSSRSPATVDSVRGREPLR
ncbi:hypothetical protein MAHJHV63_54950 [Mycobacterium avium subsp. hominissuis]